MTNIAQKKEKVGEWVWAGSRCTASPRVAYREGGDWDNRRLGLLLRSGPYLLWFLFITYKSFAFY